MGSVGCDDLLICLVLLGQVVEEVVLLYCNCGICICVEMLFGVFSIQCDVVLIYGFCNLIQNVVDFVVEEVLIEVSFDKCEICLCVVDDGLGFFVVLLFKIGDFFLIM